MNRTIGMRFAIAATLAFSFLRATDLEAQAPHGDHNPDNNGFVLMHADLHFEVVIVEDGGIELYFSSASRAPLPAAIVSDVVVEIERGGGLEFVTMQISDTGDFWTGPSIPVVNPETIVRVGFVFEAEPFFIDIPAAAFPPIMETMQDHSVDLSEFDVH